MAKKRTVLLYGRTRSGKSTCIGELAEHIKLTTGKNTRVYTADKGSSDSILPYVELGIVDLVEQLNTDPWIFLNNACKGNVRDPKTGKWVPGANDNIGMFAFESLTAFAEALMTSLADKAALGTNIGGSANISFTVSGDGESLKVGGSNMAHYNVVQTRITEEVWASQRLQADYVLWTASLSKDDDSTSGSKVLGPQVVGKALTTEVPRWFGLTFRIDCQPASVGKPEKHILYLGNSVDVNAGNAVGLGNTRVPKDAEPLPTSIEPASLVGALKLIDAAHNQALDKIKKRVGNGNQV